MIYLDATGYKFLVKEIKEKIINLKIRKIQSYDNSSFSIFFNKQNLYFENKKEAVIYLKDDKIQNTDKELNFVLKLKKHLIGGILKDIYLYKNDRIVVFEIEKLDLLNQLKKYRLVYEMLGKSINVVLINEENIIETSMYTNINASRSLLHGAEYVFPENKGFEINSEIKCKAIIYLDNTLTYTDIYPEKEKKEYNSLNNALNEYFKENNNLSQLESKRKPIIKYIRRNIKRLEKILLKIPQDLEKNKNYEKYKEVADILASNLFILKQGIEKITLFNYYTNENIIIELDKNLSPSKNMQNYYDKYAKSKRRKNSLEKRLLEIKKELEYYEEQELYTLKQDDILGLEQIEKELGLDNKKIKSTRHSKRTLYKIEKENYEIYIGRNSLENEQISFKIAKNNDLWFHSKDVPGSHVVLRANNFDENMILEAATLAAKNSKLNGTGEVDYCLIKHVKKINGGKTGQVNYTNYKSIKI